MKEAILISIKPEWCEKILNGEKTIEIRKKMPKRELPIDVYIYCTNGNILYDLSSCGVPTIEKDIKEGTLKRFGFTTEQKKSNNIISSSLTFVNRKVIAKFTLTKVDDFYVFPDGNIQYWWACDLRKACISYDNVADYIGKGKKGYAWNIENLEIFDNPKDINEFTQVKYEPTTHIWIKGLRVQKKEIPVFKAVTKAPQSWCYIEESI